MPLIGHLDQISHHRITGWAWDEDRPAAPVGLVVSVNGRVVARCLADRYRDDLQAQGIADGYACFAFTLPGVLSPLQTHEVSVRREGDGAHLVGSPGILAARTTLDRPVRDAIEQIVDGLAPDDLMGAIEFLATQTERLRDRLAGHDSGAWDRHRRRGLGWQEPAFEATDWAAAGSLTVVPRALVIDDRVPACSRDAGSDAVLSHMHALRRLGYDVTFVPATLGDGDGALEAEGFATCLAPWYSCVEDVLRRQSGAFALVYLHRMTNAARYIGLVRQHQPSARVIYAVADLHHLRMLRQAYIQGRPELLCLSERQREMEFAAARQADAVITHSTVEAELLRTDLSAGRVHVVPWVVPACPVDVPFAERRGCAFVAHYAHQPNADAARTLIERVMPAVWKEDPTYPCWLVGSSMPGWLRQSAREPAVALGAVADLATIFARVRCTVAPLAFGAGIKGKVLSSLAAGIPCACSSVAAEGLDLPELLHTLVADDADAMAKVVLRLERDEAFNARCAEVGLRYVAERNSQETVDRLLGRATL